MKTEEKKGIIKYTHIIEENNVAIFLQITTSSSGAVTAQVIKKPFKEWEANAGQDNLVQKQKQHTIIIDNSRGIKAVFKTLKTLLNRTIYNAKGEVSIVGEVPFNEKVFQAVEKIFKGENKCQI